MAVAKQKIKKIGQGNEVKVFVLFSTYRCLASRVCHQAVRFGPFGTSIISSLLIILIFESFLLPSVSSTVFSLSLGRSATLLS